MILARQVSSPLQKTKTDPNLGWGNFKIFPCSKKNINIILYSLISRFIDTIFNFTSITSGISNLFNDSSLLTYAGVAILAIVLFGKTSLETISSSSLWLMLWKLRLAVFQGWENTTNNPIHVFWSVGKLEKSANGFHSKVAMTYWMMRAESDNITGTDVVPRLCQLSAPDGAEMTPLWCWDHPAPLRIIATCILVAH